MRNKYLQLIVLLIGCLAARWLPNLTAPVKTFGYDYGFYLFNLNHSQWNGWRKLAASAWPGYGNFLFPIVHYLHVPSELFLAISHIALTMLTACACYYFWGEENRSAGMWAILLYILSVAQTQLYLMFLWKNLFGLLVFILAIKFVKEKRFAPAMIAAAGTFLVHRTSALILLVCMFCYGAYVLFQKKHFKLLPLMGLTTAAFAVYGRKFFIDQWAYFHAAPNTDVISGIFLTITDYCIYSLPLFVLGYAGLWLARHKSDQAIASIVAAVCVIWILLHLPFHNRIVPYLDIVLILYGGYAIASQATTTARRFVIAGMLLVLLTANISFTISQPPLITEQEIMEIKNVPIGIPETLVLALSADDATWLLGYLPMGRIAAPGLFENRHSYDEWQKFWSGSEDPKIFLKKYPRPLLLYGRSEHFPAQMDSCFMPVSENFRYYMCN